jgi:hypothetical protein
MNRLFPRIIVLSICIAFMLACDEEDTGINNRYITGIHIPEMAELYLPEFTLIHSRIGYFQGYEYTYKRTRDTAYIRLSVGVLKSGELADSIVKLFFNDISGYFQNGSVLGISIGDKFWFSGGNDIHSIQAVVFIRKNALLLIEGDMKLNEGVIPLAQKIDHDLVKGAPYVGLDDHLLLPVIYSITATKTILHENERAFITVLAADPYNQPLSFYGSLMNHDSSLPPNVFSITASKGSPGTPFYGKHSFVFLAINAGNLVSDWASIEIEYIP